MSDSTIADDLKAARALLEKGWCQNALERQGSFCALGAIAKATTGSTREWDVQRSQPCYQAVAAFVPAEYVIISIFNNAPETTHEDVLNLFNKALAELGALA